LRSIRSSAAISDKVGKKAASGLAPAVQARAPARRELYVAAGALDSIYWHWRPERDASRLSGAIRVGLSVQALLNPARLQKLPKQFLANRDQFEKNVRRGLFSHPRFAFSEEGESGIRRTLKPGTPAF
jgi:hypothetical protein